MVRVLFIALVSLVLPAARAESVDFNNEVRPILSEFCFPCHGPDKETRKADLRLDRIDTAVRETHSGVQPIVPGHPEKSDLIRRLSSRDPEEKMPPPKTGKNLTLSQFETLRRWIADGAVPDTHWSFKPVGSVAVPRPLSGVSQPVNPIDAFVQARLAGRGLRLSPAADPATLLRRVSFDLTGLPPTPAELDRFFSDSAPDAYERAVDRLLSSPHYGERMAVDWLDAARYADTNGYFGDKTREIWPWRDWVIRAFNHNLPFDVFTIEQIAGDLLPGATTEQRIATGFNRNHMVTNESGVIDEEYRVEYVADRVETTGAVWLGLTVGCARCHDHKYDPLSQRDYYRLFACFNNVVETGLVREESPPPVLAVPDAAAERALEALKSELADAEAGFDRALRPHREALTRWEKHLTDQPPLPPDRSLLSRFGFEPMEETARSVGTAEDVDGIVGRAARFDGMQHFELPADTPLQADRAWTIGWWMRPDGALSGILGKVEPEGRRRGFEVYWQKGRLHVHLIQEWGIKAVELVLVEPVTGGQWLQVAIRHDGSGKASGLTLFINGQPAAVEVRRDTLDGPITNAEPLRIGRRDDGLGYYGLLDEWRIHGRALGDEEIHRWWWDQQSRAILTAGPAKRDATQQALLLAAFLEERGDDTLKQLHLALGETRKAVERMRAKLPRTLVMQERDVPRSTRVLSRGQYDQPGETVKPGVPTFLPALMPGDPPNRLGLARWLVSETQPLTPRVAVNRLWLQCFGEGLVKTVEDFGLQGEAPSHPALLNWLARRFVDSGWDVKALLRLIVTSDTYRQSSVPSPDLLADDPENRLLGRGPRFRLPAEMIRDQALAASGLLSRRPGGPGVMPYQPPGLWTDVTYDGEERYSADRDDGLWRRSLYTFWKRQLPPPAMQTFDSPTREKCTLRRARTNTPLQALVLLNDDTYLEAGRALAALVLEEPGDDEQRLRAAFRRVLSRFPTEPELGILRTLLQRQRGGFRADPGSARDLVAVGASPIGRGLDPVDLAAWSLTLHTLFTLDEAITRR
ncbi:MAG: DUF1553 domain-containing protein [Verrucomicrobiales bacterium]